MGFEKIGFAKSGKNEEKSTPVPTTPAKSAAPSPVVGAPAAPATTTPTTAAAPATTPVAATTKD
jgi:hypothetical protein